MGNNPSASGGIRPPSTMPNPNDNTKDRASLKSANPANFRPTIATTNNNTTAAKPTIATNRMDVNSETKIKKSTTILNSTTLSAPGGTTPTLTPAPAPAPPATLTTTSGNLTNAVTSSDPETKRTTSGFSLTRDNLNPKFRSSAKSETSENAKRKSETSLVSSSTTSSQWYKWSKYEQSKRSKGVPAWYLSSPETKTDMPAVTEATEASNNGREEENDASNIFVMPSFQLRSTAVYSPPHGDRILPGRKDFEGTDIEPTPFKYYIPESQPQEKSGHHTKATMYQMDTKNKQVPLPTQVSTAALNATVKKNREQTGDSTNSTFVSIGLQTDLVPPTVRLVAPQIPYYERYQAQNVPMSAMLNQNPNNRVVYYVPANAVNQPVRLPAQAVVPTQYYLQQRPPVLRTEPYYSPPVLRPQVQTPIRPAQSQPTQPVSILKKSSKAVPPETFDPLSLQTHDQVLEELRRRNKDETDGMYRIKKVHVIEKNEPEYRVPTVTFNIPSSKADQSIARSEKLLFKELSNEN